MAPPPTPPFRPRLSRRSARPCDGFGHRRDHAPLPQRCYRRGDPAAAVEWLCSWPWTPDVAPVTVGTTPDHAGKRGTTTGRTRTLDDSHSRGSADKEFMMVHAQSDISARTWPELLSIAGKDLLGSVSCWRIWYVLATNDIKQRYRRSLLGQLWLTVSM